MRFANQNSKQWAFDSKPRKPSNWLQVNVIKFSLSSASQTLSFTSSVGVLEKLFLRLSTLLLSIFAIFMSLILMSGTIILGFAVLGSLAAWGVVPLIGIAYLLKPASITTKSQECKVNSINLVPDSIKKIEKKDHIVSLTDKRDAKVISCFSSKILGVDIFEAKSKQVEAEVFDLLVNFRTWEIPYVIAIQQKSRRFLLDTNGVEMHTSGLSLLGEDRISNIGQYDFKLFEDRIVRKKDYDNFWYDVFNSALFSSDEYWRWMASPQILLDSIENNESNARKVLSELGARFEIPKESQIVKVGLVKEVIVELVKNINADLLLMGNHGRHGFLASFIYNNTVNLVKNVDCDMIAVWVA